MRTTRMLQRNSRRFLLLLAVVTLTAAGFARSAWLKVGPGSAEALCTDALQALGQRDAERLCKLADAEELGRLQLDPIKVRALLDQVLTGTGTIHALSRQRNEQGRSDLASWSVQLGGDEFAARKLNVSAVQYQNGRWRILLSLLLRSTCFWRYGSGPGADAYRSYARRLGVLGLRGQDGEYIPLATLEANAAAVRRARGR